MIKLGDFVGQMHPDKTMILKRGIVVESLKDSYVVQSLRQGSVFKVKTHFNNKPREYNYEIIEWGPPLRVSLQASTSIFTIVDTIFLSANSRGTEVTYSVDIKYNFPFFVLGIFVGPIFNKLMDKQIKNLEAVLGPVQD